MAAPTQPLRLAAAWHVLLALASAQSLQVVR